jgi:hypothetical protein
VERWSIGSSAERGSMRRRVHEMEDIRDYLGTIGAPARMTEGSLRWLEHIAEGPATLSE